MKSKAVSTVVIAALIFALPFARSLAKESDEEVYRYYELLVRVLTEIQEKYHGPTPDPEKLFYGALRGMVSELDAYSQFEPPDIHSSVEIDTTGRFGGLGMLIAVDPDTRYITVVTPLEGTPAFRAGIHPGDHIVKIEDKPTKGMSDSEAANLMRGPKGTQVTITIVREGANRPIELSITRDLIKVESIKGYERDPAGGWKYMLDPDTGIGYVRMVQFQETTPRELRGVIAELLDQGMKALVVDLRFNSGGLLAAAVSVSDMFLNEGKIVSIKGKLTEQNEDILARRVGTFSELPVAVLVNGFSASASEIVAGALQDNNRGIVVGERTFGKALVQTLIPLEDGRSALRITTAEYLTPSGKSISRPAEKADEASWGIQPDIEVKLTREQSLQIFESRSELEILRTPSPSPSPTAAEAEEGEEEAAVDIQLQAAVCALKGALLYKQSTNEP